MGRPVSLFCVRCERFNESHILDLVNENTSFSDEELNDFMNIIVKNNEEIFGSCIAFEPYMFFDDSVSYAPYYFRSGDAVVYKNLSKSVCHPI